MKLKALKEQVIVITGATSGIGLVTAREAARRGARLVLAARDEEALNDLAAEIERQEGQAEAVVADVGWEEDIRRIAEAAERRFGGYDTWVNNAGISIYGHLEEVSMEDHRRLFETNYWGVVHGSLEACKHLRQRGGALINIGSTLSDRAIPLQGAYSASKHAVKAFTDALRMELEHDEAPVSVTLIKPGTIDTPFTEHAKSYLNEEPHNAPPVYAPETVAKAILHAAEHPVRDLFVGAGGKFISSMGQNAPRVTDRMMESSLEDIQHSGRPLERNPDGSLHEPMGSDGAERSGQYAYVMEHSAYTTATRHPLLSSMLAASAGAIAAAALLRRH